MAPDGSWKISPEDPGGSGRSKRKTAPQVREKSLPESGNDPIILCRACRAQVCREKDGIPVQGRHRHVFANPHGLVFDVVCFKAAEGCAAAGPLSGEFTWFTGYQWQVGVCRTCLSHIGWRFSGPDSVFFALITDALIFPP